MVNGFCPSPYILAPSSYPQNIEYPQYNEYLINRINGPELFLLHHDDANRYCADRCQYEIIPLLKSVIKQDAESG